MAISREAPQNLGADGRDVLNGQDGMGSATPQNRRMEAASVSQTTPVIAPLGGIRWGAIWAGVLSTLAVFVVLEFFFYAIGTLTTTSPSGAVTASNQWLSTLLLAISFFIGGMVAEATSVARGKNSGIQNGLMVWALGIAAIVILSSAFGLGAFFGVIGYTASGFMPLSHHIGMGNLNASGAGLASDARVISLAAFFSVIIVAITATLGSFVVAYAKPIGRMMTRR